MHNNEDRLLNNLTEDIKLFSNEGYISRRNYISNLLIIGVISSLFFMFIFPKMQTENVLADLLNAGPFYIILFVIQCLVFATLTAFNMSKRISDIKNIEPKNSIFCVILTIVLLCEFLPLFNYKSSIVLSLFLALAQLFFMVKKGEITSGQEKSEINKFNWGAFFGTFIWGLCNKTYISLWIIPLFFTPAWLFFGLYLGIKGNELAYKNKKYDSVEAFHKSQKKQATFWSIFTPTVSIIMFIAIVVVLSFFLVKEEQTARLEKRPSYLETVITKELKQIYTDYELNENEYKFFIDSSVWNGFSNREKESAFECAGIFAEYKNVYSETPETKEEIKSKTKIYSTEGKLLYEK